MKYLSAAAIALIAATVDAQTYGVDISQYVGDFSCLKSQGLDFAIPRAWCSYGGLDGNAAGNIANARAAGFQYVDVYMFPCRSQDAAGQVSQLLGGLGMGPKAVQVTDLEESAKGMSAGVYSEPKPRSFTTKSNDFAQWRKDNGVNDSALNADFGMVWIDVEVNPSSGCGWDQYSADSNCDYLMQLIGAVQNSGRQVGVYTSIYEWSTVMGSQGACTQAGSVPLWYAHYDSWASFGDYSQIGGWASPNMKQYIGDTTICGVGVDESFY